MTIVCAAAEYRLRLELGDAQSVEFSYVMMARDKDFLRPRK